MAFIFIASVSILAFFIQSAIMAFFAIGLAFIDSAAMPLPSIVTPSIIARSVVEVVFLIRVIALLSAVGTRRPDTPVYSPISGDPKPRSFDASGSNY
jgi:hypothetical protein